MRLGLARVQRFDSADQRSTPLTRTNFGLGPNAEIIAEFEYSADNDELAEGAVGYKWARFADGRGVGIETLTLLPVQPGQSGVGVESQFLASFSDEGWQLHLNIGGFYDPRGRDTERGFRASLLAEFPRDDFEPGVELFVKDPHEEAARVQAGFGLIKQFRFFQLRTGVHAGLSDSAPDLEASLWLAWRWQTGEK
jgi:hypothetical protein